LGMAAGKASRAGSCPRLGTASRFDRSPSGRVTFVSPVRPVRVKHGLVSAGTVSLETPVVRGSVVPRYPKFQDPQHLEFW